jgi:hypothetical protein
VPHALLLRRDVRVDPRLHGDAVAAATGLTKLESRLAVRKGRGILLENLAEPAARSLAERLNADGVEVAVVDSALLPPLPAPRRITQLVASDDLLTLRTPSGEEESAPWEAIGTVHAAAVVLQEYRQYFEHMPTGTMPALHKMEGAERDLVRENLILKMEAKGPDRKLKHETRPESVFHEADQRHRGKLRLMADLLTEDSGTRWRVAMDELSWGTGEAKVGGPAAMKRLFEELRARRPGALSEAALCLLDAPDIREQVFPDIEEYNRYVAWCAWKGIAWPSAASSSPSPEPPASSTDAASSNASPGPEPGST